MDLVQGDEEVLGFDGQNGHTRFSTNSALTLSDKAYPSAVR
jgi:hypothetical protein